MWVLLSLICNNTVFVGEEPNTPHHCPGGGKKWFHHIAFRFAHVANIAQCQHNFLPYWKVLRRETGVVVLEILGHLFTLKLSGHCTTVDNEVWSTEYQRSRLDFCTVLVQQRLVQMVQGSRVPVAAAPSCGPRIALHLPALLRHWIGRDSSSSGFMLFESIISKVWV